VGGLLSGDYHVHALKTDYATMWYDNVSRETLGGVTLATKITVTAPADVPSINITLPLAGKISGYVYEANGTTPIAGAMVVADYKDGSSYLYVNAAETGIDGSYSINGLVTDNYFLHAVANGHRTIFYNQHVMEYDSDPVGVTAPGTTPGINFSLPLVGSISGTVYEQDGITPVAGARVIAYYWSSGSFGQEAYTDAEGKYKIEGLGATYFAVRADITGFDTEWYSNKTAWEYLDINTDRIQVVPPADVPGIDFTLNSHAPRVATVEAGNVASTSVTLNGNLTWVGTETSIAVSFEYGQTEGGPYTAVAAGTRGSIGSFATDVSGLTPGTTYYFRAKAVASGYDPVYGDELPVTTLPVPPTVTTGVATGVTATTATLGGDLTSLGTPAENVTVSFEWGTVAGGPYPSYSAGQTMANTGAFSASLTGLSASTTYYFRAKADGVGDPVYGLEKDFSTLSDGTLPSATTGDASNITTTTATLSGNLTGMGTATTVMVSFEYGTTTSYGSETTAQSMTAIGSATANLTGLTAGTTYHFRIKADGEGEPIEGADKEFTTSTADTTAPVISSLATSAITTKGATITWTTDEAATSQVQYGLTAEYGSTSDEVTTLSTSHSASLTDLKAGKTYHYRVISKDAAGNQKVSDDGTFTTEKSSGGGMPVWAWVLIALAAVGVVGGGAAAFFMKGRAAK
jgi:phosphodiesterase/alkaline phosphatase D-like protein